MTLPSGIGGRTTEQVGYFACPAPVFADWLWEGLEGEWERVRPPWRSLEDALVSLAPAGVVNRYACIPNGDWVIVLNNSPLGTDVGVLPSLAARELRCRSLRAVCVDDDDDFPARILEVFGPDGAPPLALERSIVAARDGDRWVFETSGEPFSFEDLSAYTRRRRASRFTSDMLIEYLSALGVPADDEPQWGEALVLERRPG